jgi:ADP-ribosylglycohydrolase
LVEKFTRTDIGKRWEGGEERMTKNEQLHLLTTALCCGDALGATSEFMAQQAVPSLYEEHKHTGWPFVQIGGGTFDWQPGEHTDDGQMALVMVTSYVARGRFDPSDIAHRWIQWMDSFPPDIGGTTQSGLASVKRGTPWHEGGLNDFRSDPMSAANGSLMRNAPVAAMADTLEQAFEFSLKQSIITHYGPLPVICCCAQTFLLWNFLDGNKGLDPGWQHDFHECFSQSLKDSDDGVVRSWSETTLRHQIRAWDMFLEADYDRHLFNPFGLNFWGRSGYCLLTLQIAVWAIQWSIAGQAVPTPSGFTGQPFEKAIGPALGAVVGLIGHDSDTYGAVAFPLIAAVHGMLPGTMTNNLKVIGDLRNLGLQGRRAIGCSDDVNSYVMDRCTSRTTFVRRCFQERIAQTEHLARQAGKPRSGGHDGKKRKRSESP